MTLTGKHIEQVLRSIPGARGGQVASVDELAAGANEALLTAPPGLTEKGAAAFLATMSQESASFRATEEYAKHGRYAPYIGRTFEMLTWKDNYRYFGGWCAAHGLLSDPDAFVDNPRKLADVRWAWLGGIWFWQAHGIWAHGNRGDFLATQRAVNLGNPTSAHTPVGMTARTAWYRAWLEVGPDLVPTPEPPTGRPYDMAAAEDVYVNYAGKQALTPGDNEVKINEKGGKTFATGPNDGIDLLATIDVADASGATQGVEAFFRVVSYLDQTPTTTISSRRPTGSDQVSYKGRLSADDDKTRSARLRLVVRVPADVTGAVLKSVQVTGWKL